ncbi:MAG TPA: molybdenum cofactor biosynthesis protein MoaE [Acidobacteriota bacterium]|nr:molybdenum cofactor biosynthesis protein MoaE [Acidobacteriota bacterium]
MARIIAELVREPIDAAAAAAALGAPGAGAVVTFVGTVRDQNRGRAVTAMEYEAYLEMARPLLAELAAETAARFRLEGVVLIHRLGRLAVGEAAVFIGVASAHRAEAFDAARRLIDTLKERVPIWKKEHYADGSAWIDGEGSHGA